VTFNPASHQSISNPIGHKVRKPVNSAAGIRYRRPAGRGVMLAQRTSAVLKVSI